MNFLDNSPYCKCDPNEVIVYNDYAEIILRDKSGYELGFFDSFEEAVIARKNAEENLYGEYQYKE